MYLIIENNTLYTSNKFNIGQVNKSDAQNEVDRLNRQEETKAWKICKAKFMFEVGVDERGGDNPCQLGKGNVWVAKPSVFLGSDFEFEHTLGEWSQNKHHIMMEGEVGARGQSYVQALPSHGQVDFEDTEGLANARLMAQAQASDECPLGSIPVEIAVIINDYAVGSQYGSFFMKQFDKKPTKENLDSAKDMALS